VFPGFFSQDAKSLLTGLLNRDPNERFGTDQVRSHPFFANIDWKVLERKEMTPPWKPPNAMNIDAEVLSVCSVKLSIIDVLTTKNQVEVTDSYNGGRPGLVIDEKDVDAFDGFTYVGGMNNNTNTAAEEAPKVEEKKTEEVIEIKAIEEKKPEEITVEEVIEVAVIEEKTVEDNKPDLAEVKVETNNVDENNKHTENTNTSARVEILQEVPLSPKSMTSEDDSDSESSNEDSESSVSERESDDGSSSNDSEPRGPFIVRLPGQQ
jgi:serine/threonine protein kinase